MLFTSTSLSGWTELMTFAGTGGLLTYAHAGVGSGEKRFWRLEMKEGGY